MSNPGYPAASTVARKVVALFAKHAEAARIADSQHVPPRLEDVEAVVDAAFWASLRREEGYVPKISLALVPPERTLQPLRFDRSLSLKPTSLVRVAPAVERPGIHLGVWCEGNDLKVWGTTRTIPAFCFVLEVAAPGLLVVKHHRGDGGKYVNVAVLEGDQIKMIDERARSMPDCPSLLTSLLGFDSPGWQGTVNVLVEMAVSMRAHGRGGILLVVRAGSEGWRDSIVHPIPYAVVPPFQSLAELVHHAQHTDRHTREWHDQVEEAVSVLAGLTAVDGATVLTDRCELLAFGAKISRRDGSPLVEEVAVTEPIENAEAAVMHPSRLGGTRHLSAAQFVHDQREAVALVASQDGRFTVFAWSPCEARVHAHRIESLLL